MVLTTQIRSRAETTEEMEAIMIDPIPKVKKPTSKPKSTQKPKTDEDRSRPRTRAPPGEKARSVSAMTPPKNTRAVSVDTETRSESKSVSRKASTPTKEGGIRLREIDDAEDAATKSMAKVRSQSMPPLKKETIMTVTKEKALKVTVASKKPPTQKRPRSQSQSKQIQKNTTAKKPKLELNNNPKLKNPPKQKPAAEAKKIASRAPHTNTSSPAEEFESDDDVPIARRTRSLSSSVAPAPVKRAHTARARAPRTKDNAGSSDDPESGNNAPAKSTKVLKTQPEQISITRGNNSSVCSSCYRQMKSVKQFIDVSTCSKTEYRKHKKLAVKSTVNAETRVVNINTIWKPSVEDTCELPVDSGLVPNASLNSVVTALAQNTDPENFNKTLAGICYSMLAKAAASSFHDGEIVEGTGTQISSTSPASDSSTIEVVRLDQVGSCEPRTTPVPEAAVTAQDSNFDHVTPNVDSEDLSFSLQLHVEKKNQETQQRKSFTVLKFTDEEQQQQFATIFKECFNNSRE